MSEEGEAAATARAWAVIVLTGGGSRRMGQDKATLDVAGATLLDRTLAGVPPEVDVIVAGPPVVVARPGVRFVQENPPGGGPVAGVAAALDVVTVAVVVILATDLPVVGTLPTALARVLLEAGDSAASDAVLAVDASGRAQQLCGAYRTQALRSAISEGGTVNGASMRSVVERLNTSTLSAIAHLEVSGETVEVDPTWDIDTPEDLRALHDMFGPGETDH
jgi:molybdopterin-guanine dinucleotide biosynthesis protein A